MSEEEDRHTLSIQLANQIINTANNRLQEGMDPIDIAAGMRHAAANFTAFAVANSETPDDVDPTHFAEEFLQIYAYYLEKHVTPKQVESGLDALIKQVRDES
ncbi:MAG: DUF3144 domain-containing protein [Rhodospirillales bacterium]|nr:DUF3144 domain-containing protein [Rhodospirillales bacterium]